MMKLDFKEKPRRVLIADDNPVTRRMLSSLIHKESFTPVEVCDGGEAFRILKADADFAAAIIDIRMPHLNGLDLVKHMRTEKRLMRIPVLIVTGDDNVKVMADSFQAGAAAFLAKSFTPAQLQSAFRVLLKNTSATCRRISC